MNIFQGTHFGDLLHTNTKGGAEATKGHRFFFTEA